MLRPQARQAALGADGDAVARRSGQRANDPAALTPVTDGENVYSFFADFGLVSYDSAGAVRWRLPLGPFNNTMGMGASPILAGSNVIVVADQNDDSYIAAFDRRNGEIRWKIARAEKDGWALPLLFETGGIVTTSRGQLGLHRAADGARAWTYDKLSPAIVASPILDRDILYTFDLGDDEPSPFAGQLTKFDKNHDGQLTPDEYGKDPMLLALGKYAGNRDLIVTRDEWDEKQRQVVTPSILMAVKLERDGPRELWRYEKNFVSVVPSPLLFQGKGVVGPNLQQIGDLAEQTGNRDVFHGRRDYNCRAAFPPAPCRRVIFAIKSDSFSWPDSTALAAHGNRRHRPRVLARGDRLLRSQRRGARAGGGGSRRASELIAGGLPPWISVDQEGGRVARFKKGSRCGPRWRRSVAAGTYAGEALRRRAGGRTQGRRNHARLCARAGRLHQPEEHCDR